MGKLENTKFILSTPILHNRASFSPAQAEYFDEIRAGQSVFEIVWKNLARGRLVSFADLKHVIDLVTGAKSEVKSDGEKKSKAIRTEDFFEVICENHPFFLAMPPLVKDLFKSTAEVLHRASGESFCRNGDCDRDLYVILDGEVGVYSALGQGTRGRRLVCNLDSGAIFGEVGFFLGKPRTADVVALKDTAVVKFNYSEELFGKLINPGVANKLQARFRVAHALSKAKWLKSLPHEILDQLIFAGRIRQVKEYEILCKEGEYQDSIFIVVQGSVSIQQGPQVVAVNGPGDSFGEIALFFTQGRRTATAMAQRDSMVLEISSKEFYQLLANNLFLACEFERMAIERLQKIQSRVKKAA